MQFNEILKTPLYSEEHYSKTVEWLNDPTLRSSFGITTQVTIETHKRWVSENPQIEILPLFVGSHYVGNVVLHHQQKHKSTYLQIYIGEPSFQGKGYGKSFMTLAIDHVFNRMKHHRLWLHVRDTNLAAKRLYASLGFQDEGIERDSVLDSGKFVSQRRLSLLVTDVKIQKIKRED